MIIFIVGFDGKKKKKEKKLLNFSASDNFFISSYKASFRLNCETIKILNDILLEGNKLDKVEINFE